MVKLKSLKVSAKLKQWTSLRHILYFPARWISTFRMLKWFQKLRKYLPKNGVQEISVLLPSAAEENALDHICALYSELELVCKRLQYDFTTTSDACAFSDALLVKQRTSAECLCQTATIVMHHDFECCVIKVQENFISELSDGKCDALSQPRLSNTASFIVADASFSFPDGAI